jgi:hypothetical protein
MEVKRKVAESFLDAHCKCWWLRLLRMHAFADILYGLPFVGIFYGISLIDLFYRHFKEHSFEPIFYSHLEKALILAQKSYPPIDLLQSNFSQEIKKTSDTTKSLSGSGKCVQEVTYRNAGRSLCTVVLFSVQWKYISFHFFRRGKVSI